jgi:tetratricopeptide (TPR) repeat protein
VAQNPRLDDLRKRLEREPGSRLFAQLAEELRKDGDLAEAIRVCREGLEKQPAYPSARMTLGRALMDTGDLAAARGEFESVLKGAPDNILASRFLSECLEGLGEWALAAQRYRATLALAPGDKNLTAKIESLDARAREPVSAPVAGPIPVVAAEEDFELEGGGYHGEAASAAAAPPTDAASEVPIPVSAVDEPFEIEHAQPPPATARPIPAAPEGRPPVVPEALDRTLPPDSFGLPGVEPIFEAEPLPVPKPPVEPPAPPPTGATPAPPGPATADPGLNTATLAELYFNQGFTEKAVEVYREMLALDPGNGRLEARLAEIEALDRHLRGVETPESMPAVAEPGQSRRQAVERTIERLEALLAAVKRA